MTYRTIALGLMLFAIAGVGATQAQDTQSAKSVIIEIDAKDSESSGVQRCADNPQAMSACRSFIKGFIQGALLTDAAIINTIEKSESSYAGRAFKTRLRGRENRTATALAGFCLPEDRTILSIAEETLDHVKNAERNSAELAKRVYQSLKVDYRCEQ
jgi:hypothetical protein